MKDRGRESNRFARQQIEKEQILNKKVEPMLQTMATRFDEKLRDFFETEEGKELQQRAVSLIDDFDKNIVIAQGIPESVLMIRLKRAFDILEELGNIGTSLIERFGSLSNYLALRDAETRGTPSTRRYFEMVDSQVALTNRNYVQKHLFTGLHADLQIEDLNDRFEKAYTKVNGFPPPRNE